MSKSRNTSLVLIMKMIGRFGKMALTFKIFGGILMGLAFFMVLGTAGADCDGKCMENSLTLGEIFFNLGLAAFAGFMGYQMYMYGVERDV